MASTSTTIMYKPTPVTIEALQVDATPRESHGFHSTVTDHPVEEGVNFSDHSRPEPDTLILDCLITNTPLDSTSSVQQGTQSVPPGASAGSTQPQEASRDQQAYFKLKALRDVGTLITVATALRSYTSMVITDVSVARTSRNFNALEFTVSFKFVRVVQNKLTQLVVAKDKRVPPENKAGNQTPVEEEVETSTAKAATDRANAAKAKGSGVFGQLYQGVAGGL